MYSLSQLIKRAKQTNRNGIATDFEGRRQSWEQFVDRVARLAGGLHTQGISSHSTSSGERIAILSKNSDIFFESYFGIPWAGAIFVPINTRLALPEIVYVLKDSGSQLLFVDDHFLEMLSDIQKQVETLKKIIYLGHGKTPQGTISYESLIQDSTPAEDAGRRGDDVAVIYYTGGTTGRSKGVMVSHGSLVCNALQTHTLFPINRDDIYLHAAPMFHIVDGMLGTVAAMMACEHKIIPGFEPLATLQAIEQGRVSKALLVPTMVNMLVNHPDVSKYDLSSLKAVFYGGSPMPEAIILKAMEVIPSTQFFQGYGQSETINLTLLDPSRHVLEGPKAGKLNSAGQPAPGIEIAIHDEDDREMPPGQMGEVCVRSKTVMQGYWNMPEETAKTLKGGWCHTGDGGYIDEDGFVFIVDRLKDMVISGGENIYSIEVENAIYQLADVLECAVVGIPSEKWGEAVHAIVVLQESSSATEETIITHCRNLIAGYKCPRSVEIRSERLPLSGAGKILKRELREPYWKDKT